MDHDHAATTSADSRPESDTEHLTCRRCVGRRTALMGIGAVGVAGLLAACGGDDSDDAGAPAETAPGDDATATEPGPPAEEPTEPVEEPTEPVEEPTETEGGAEPLTTTAEVPVGGGVILNGPGVVVTQPIAGEFMAFSATCTHQGCAVTEVGDGLITCSCHGSQYSVTDGSVQQGPAEQPLPPVAIVVEGDQILPA